MSTRGRGRGVPKVGEGGAGTPRKTGARSRPQETPPRPPHESTVRELMSEQPPKEGQFDDIEDPDRAGTTASLIKGDSSNIELPHPPISPRRDTDSDVNPISPEFSPPPLTTTKLNPSAPEFSPSNIHTPPTSSALSPKTGISSTTKLNPSTPEFSPSLSNGSGAHISKTSFTGKQSSLDPRSTEFIPKTVQITTTSLNASAPAFVPNTQLTTTAMQNGTLSEEEEEELLTVMSSREEDPEPPQLTSKDFLSGVAFPVQETGEENELVLKATAEVLSKASMYPASLERGKSKINTTIKSWEPDENVFLNLAELLVHWGVKEPALRFTVSKICQSISEVSAVFRKQLVRRLKVHFDDRMSLEKEKLIDLSLFFAEIFSRIRTDEGDPVRIPGIAVAELVVQILTNIEERSIISACHILKLTGRLLAMLPGEVETKMTNVMGTLSGLKTNSSTQLSKKCVQIVSSVLDLHARGWSDESGHPQLSARPSDYNDFGGGVIPGEEEFVNFGTVPGDAVFQAPVSNPAEWSEFLDDDNQLIEDSDQHAIESFMIEKRAGGGGGRGGEDEEEALDAEIEKEFEFFVQDLEEHLLNMGEMDPEQFEEQEQGAGGSSEAH